MKKVAVLDDYQRVAESLADWLRLSPRADVSFFHDTLSDSADLAERLKGFHVVCLMRERTPFSAELIERLPDLELILTTGPANGAIDLDVAVASGITVCGTSGVVRGTPELTWALVLALARDVPAQDASIRAGGWQLGLGTQLHGHTLGLLGLGRIGSIVAGYGQAFGMEVIAWSENLSSEHAASHGVTRVDKEELLERADVVSIHLRLSERTRGLLGSRELALMKPTAFLVNTSRSAIVDESALMAALEADGLAGVALDVYGEEPLPQAHPLRTSRRTVLTPHVGYVTRETYEVFYPETVDAIEAWLDGNPIRVIAEPA